MGIPLRVLIVEDNEDDVLLLMRQIQQGGFDVSFERVESAAATSKALDRERWDLVVSDYAVPGLDGMAALRLVKEKDIDVPFIIVSGTIGQDIAVQAMKAGASDYVMKDSLARLAPAVSRELREAEGRRERKRAEEALRQAEEQYRSIFENAVEGMFQSTPAGKFITVNPALVRMLGYSSPAELIAGGQKLQLVTDQVRRKDYERQLAERGVTSGFECRAMKKDGTNIWVSLSTRMVREANGEILRYEGTVEDITERKKLEEQFRQSQKMEAFGQLAAGVAHDFNNLLTVIQGNLSLLQEVRVGNADEVALGHEAMQAAERATHLTRQLLTFGRRQPLQPRDLDLNEIVAGTTKMLQRLIGEHIALETLPAPGGAPVHADPGMMEQVLLNLAVNARDAMPSGGRLVVQTSSITLDQPVTKAGLELRPGNYVHLSLSDTGAGIELEHLPHIFEPFFTTKEIGKGTGLGLATVFTIIEQHHGAIEVESSVGRGTTVRIYLPRIDLPMPSLAQASAPPPVRGGTETILIVEDEPSVRVLMRTVLERQGYRVHEAVSGTAALLVWENRSTMLDLLITDMVMPDGVGGRKLADRMTAQNPRLKVIYCSGYNDDVLGKDSPLRNKVNFIEKPFDLHGFLQRVRELLDRR